MEQKKSYVVTQKSSVGAGGEIFVRRLHMVHGPTIFITPSFYFSKFQESYLYLVLFFILIAYCLDVNISLQFLVN